MNRYPLWKNILLVIIVILGFLYASPNLFGDDASVQVSGKHGAMINSAVLTQVENVLSQQQLPYKSAKIENQENQNILVRFNNTDTQLKASDFIKAALGDDYTVALSLAPATPDWLTSIGALPMKLGLDLRGGVHFLINVDIDSVISRRQQGVVTSMIADLRDKHIRYSNVVLQNDNSILLTFRDADQKTAALDFLRSEFPDLTPTDTSAGNTYSLSAVLSQAGLEKIREYTLDQTMTTLRNRVNELGVSDAIVQQQGSDRVSVDLPGIQDTAHAKDILGGTATVEFHMVNTTSDPQTAMSGFAPPGSTLYQFEGRPVLLQNQVLLTGSSITDASASFDDAGRPSVNIRLGGGGESLFNRVTAQNVGNPMATVFIETTFDTKIVDGKPVKVPQKTEKIINIATIQSALGNNFQVTGLGSQRESQNLSLLLRAGALPAAINYEEERTVGPTLGQENIHKGVLSIEVALAIVIIFMAFYYRLFGLIADAALLLNLILLLALLSLLGATLTLPGMAGIVLTLGLAVDANVLIFERIREEVRNGMSPQASIFHGYERAFVTIVDANVTTLIVAMVLFGIGTDAVKGFAVTLTLGVLTSMVTAIMFTRAMVNAIYGSRTVKKLSIGM
ncbi:MAG TPA: protein translocase subunit SecD [Gammaproteobacteria bacterium]|nr:protein translocase subunit SecD [Gammaproteobacteria bacterium]